MMDVNDADEEFPTFRTQTEADGLLPEAREVVDEIIRRLPSGLYRIDPGTLFVAYGTQQPVACFAAGLVGRRFQLAPVEFELKQPFEETVEKIVNRLLQWHAGLESSEDM